MQLLQVSQAIQGRGTFHIAKLLGEKFFSKMEASYGYNF
jgi:hypothetical protein